MEKLVHQRLDFFFENSKILYDDQFGFRNKHSISHTLIKITEVIDKKKFACGIFIDLHEAFDTVNHDILSAKLECYGVKGISSIWF